MEELRSEPHPIFRPLGRRRQQDKALDTYDSVCPPCLWPSTQAFEHWVRPALDVNPSLHVAL